MLTNTNVKGIGSIHLVKPDGEYVELGGIQDISINTSPKFNYSMHKELWNWLSLNPDKEKEDWPGWDYLSEPEEYSHCFACQYADCIPEAPACANCPLIWPSTDSSHTSCTDSIYLEWKECIDLEQKSILAKQIANLPVKENVLCV
jgi:hypothetical protein